MSGDDDIRYRLRPRERTAVLTPPRGVPTRDPAPPAAVAAGSHPEIELGPLDAPVAPPRTLRFGGAAVVIERSGTTVTLVLPGGGRIVGDERDAAALAAVLAAPPSRG